MAEHDTVGGLVAALAGNQVRTDRWFHCTSDRCSDACCVSVQNHDTAAAGCAESEPAHQREFWAPQCAEKIDSIASSPMVSTPPCHGGIDDGTFGLDHRRVGARPAADDLCGRQPEHR
jgi:hypothetical protein